MLSKHHLLLVHCDATSPKWFGRHRRLRRRFDEVAGPGETVVITAGVPFGTPDATDVLRIESVLPLDAGSSRPLILRKQPPPPAAFATRTYGIQSVSGPENRPDKQARIKLTINTLDLTRTRPSFKFQGASGLSR